MAVQMTEMPSKLRKNGNFSENLLQLPSDWGHRPQIPVCVKRRQALALSLSLPLSEIPFACICADAVILIFFRKRLGESSIRADILK